MRIIETLKNQWRIYMGVSSKFSENPLVNENDWYCKNSWFSLYFYDKLKRKIMSIIYKLYSSIEELLLEKYLVEFYFFTTPSNKLEEYNKKHKTNYLGDFKCYLPILFMVKNYDEVECLTGIINRQLIKEYGCSIIQTNISDKIESEKMIEHRIKASTDKLRGYQTGELDILTFTPKPTNKELEIKYQRRSDKYNFQILKSGPNLLRDKFEYVIQFYKTVTED